MAHTKATAAIPGHVDAKVNKTLDNLRRHYHRGQQVMGLLKTMRPAEVAEKLKTNPNTLRKQRQFAKLYSKSEFNELCRLRRSDGMPLHWGHVVFLITVADKKNRQRLQHQAVQEDWAAQELLQKIQSNITPDSIRGGRTLRKPMSRQSQLLQIREETRMWLRRYHEIWAAEDGCLRTTGNQKDGSIEGELVEMLTNMAKAAKTATKLLEP